jgi:hypothetical protein
LTQSGYRLCDGTGGQTVGDDMRGTKKFRARKSDGLPAMVAELMASGTQ